MTARDRYVLKLTCLNCGHTGEAKISENDGWSYMSGIDRRIDGLSEGITYKEGNIGSEKFICKCGNEMKHTGWVD